MTSLTKGKAEEKDVQSIIDYILRNKNLPPSKIVICGYSYGAMCSCSIAAEIPEVLCYTAISYPYSVSWMLTAGNSQHFERRLIQPKTPIPKLFIIGDKDQFSSISKWRSLVERIQDPKHIVVIEGVDHFWWNKENKLVDSIEQWLLPIVQQWNPHIWTNNSINQL